MNVVCDHDMYLGFASPATRCEHGVRVMVRPFDKGGRYLYPAYGQERANIMRAACTGKAP